MQFGSECAKLQQLNEVSNAYKHSFLNSDLNLVGRDEPVVYSLSVERNNLALQPKYSAIALRDFVDHCDQLFGFFRMKCAEYFPRH